MKRYIPILILTIATALALVADSFSGNGGSGGGLTLIAKQTLAAPAASFTFTNIPGTYTNLVLVVTAASDQATQFENTIVQFNSDTGANYNNQLTTGVGTTAPASFSSASNTSITPNTLPGSTSPAGTVGALQMRILNYAGTTVWKEVLYDAGQTRDGLATTMQSYNGWGEWKSTAAITSVKFAPAAGNLIIGSQAVLYGEN